MLVDDDSIFCQVLEQALGKRELDVFCAVDLTAVIALTEEHCPECAIIDLRIGNESGLVLVKMFKALDENMRIVILAGYASIATRVEAIKLGAMHYLIKPAEVDEIIPALHQNESDPSNAPTTQPISIKWLEWEHMQKVLMDNDGNISAAARALKMHRRTLQRKCPVKN